MSFKNQILSATSRDAASALIKEARKLPDISARNLAKCETAFRTIFKRLRPARKPAAKRETVAPVTKTKAAPKKHAPRKVAQTI